MKKLYLASIKDDEIETSSAIIEEETDTYYLLRTKLADTKVVGKNIVHDSNGDFFAFGLTEKGALLKLKTKQEEKKQEVQNIIDKIDNIL